MFGVENIYTNQKGKLIGKEECSREYAHGLWEVVKFQIISLVVSRTCERDRDSQSLLFLHLGWFKILLLRFRGLSFEKRSLRMTVLTEIEAGPWHHWFSCTRFSIQNICTRTHEHARTNTQTKHSTNTTKCKKLHFGNEAPWESVMFRSRHVGDYPKMCFRFQPVRGLGPLSEQKLIGLVARKLWNNVKRRPVRKWFGSQDSG